MRLEEKEQFLTKKTKQLQDLTDEKSTLTGEIRDMKDMLDVKERKVNVLQKKVCEPNIISVSLVVKPVLQHLKYIQISSFQVGLIYFKAGVTLRGWSHLGAGQFAFIVTAFSFRLTFSKMSERKKLQMNANAAPCELFVQICMQLT